MPITVRRRYLALKIGAQVTFSSGELMSVILGAVLKLYGEYGASLTHLALIDYDEERETAILRTNHTTVDMVRAALASITKMGDKPVTIYVQRVSGTIKALRQKMK